MKNSQNKKDNGKIKVYIISNIHPSRHKHIESVCSKFDTNFDIFMPHKDNEYNLDNSKIEYYVFLKDQTEIDKADVCLIIMPLFGRDCASEIGYSKGSAKRNIAYVENMKTTQERDWLDDWMVKGFIDFIITPSKETYNLLMKNKFIKEKHKMNSNETIFLIKEEEQLDHIVKEIMQIK